MQFPRIRTSSATAGGSFANLISIPTYRKSGVIVYDFNFEPLTVPYFKKNIENSKQFEFFYFMAISKKLG
jgi:hypothetical protein